MSTRFARNRAAAGPVLALASLIIAATATGALAAGRAVRPTVARCLNERHAYLRGEKATLEWEAADGDALQCDVGGWLPERIPVRGERARYTVETALLRAGDYDVRAQPLRGGKPVGEVGIFRISIAPERNPQRFPVWNWPSTYARDLRWWAERGFSGLHLSTASGPLEPNSEQTRALTRVLDDATRLGVDMGVYLQPLNASRWAQEESVRCLLPGGQRDERRVYPREPVVLEHARRTAAAWVERFAEYPSFRHALLSSEYQTPICVNDVVRSLLKTEAGLDLDAVLRREWTRGGGAIDTAQLPPELAPKEGVIPDEHPIYRFLKWWWERGHGTSVSNAEMARVLKAKRPDMLVWHDPYRLAPVYGSHAGLDAISTWTYGHPDIKRLAYTTVLQAAARREHQKVMQTISLWVYGRFVIPIGTPTADLLADRPGRDPHFTNGPDYTREAMWLVISQRPDLLNFYSSSGDPPNNPALDPFLISPETFDAIGEVCRTLIQPYGPVVLQSRRVQPRVAVLMSAAATWFPAAPRGVGYVNEQILPFCALLWMNHVPFDVLLDDDIREGRLRDFAALVIPRGDTLTESMHRRITEFARGGGKVIADRTLRARVPGAAITDFDFSFERDVDGNALAAGRAVTAEEHRSRMEAYAERLKPLLAGLARPAESDSKRVVINTLESGDVRYHFLVNDDRTYGPRFGPWKLMQESGVRQTAKVRIAASGATLYDAFVRKPITAASRSGQAEFEVTLPPSRGKLIAALPEAIGKIEVGLPPACERGKPCPITVRVRGVSGKPLRGALPLRIDLIDPSGRPSEFNRYASTVAAGEAASARYEYALPFLPGLNDLPGEWTLRITELLGGSQTEQALSVR